jgi:hypothetical protein
MHVFRCEEIVEIERDEPQWEPGAAIPAGNSHKKVPRSYFEHGSVAVAVFFRALRPS